MKIEKKLTQFILKIILERIERDNFGAFEAKIIEVMR